MPHWSYREMREAFGFELEQYLYFGDYPGAADLVADRDRWASYVLDSLVETTLSRDVLLLTRVDKPALLRQVFRLGCEYPPTRRRVSLSLPPCRGSRPGVAPRDIGRENRQGEGFVDLEDPRTMGARLRQIRNSRKKSLVMVAGLAGISKSHLQRIETGQVALDSRAETVALANALGVAPSELTRWPERTAGNGEGPAVKAIRRALIAVSRDDPAGQVMPVDMLRTRIEALVVAQRQCEHEKVGRQLSALIRDLHTSLLAARQDVRELLAVAVLLHVQGSHAFLGDMGAPADLCWQTATLARQSAREHGGSEIVGLATFGAANGLLAAGDFDIAQAELDSVTVPTTTGTAEQLDGMLALSRSLVAAADKRLSDVDAPLEYAADLATRTGEGNAYWLGFGPTNVGVWRMGVALEARDFPKAASIAEGLQPSLLPSATRQATYWANYGRALARIRGRQDDAVRALRKAELISPARVQRHPFVREVLGELLARSRRTQSAGSCGGWPTGLTSACSPA